MLSKDEVLETLQLLASGLKYPVWLAGGLAADFHVGRWTRDHCDIDLVGFDEHRSGVSADLAGCGFTHTHDRGWITRWTCYGREIGEVSLAFLRRSDTTTGALVIPEGGEAAPGIYPGVPGNMAPDRFRTLEGIGFRVMSAEDEWVYAKGFRSMHPGTTESATVRHNLALLKSVIEPSVLKELRGVVVVDFRSTRRFRLDGSSHCVQSLHASDIPIRIMTLDDETFRRPLAGDPVIERVAPDRSYDPTIYQGAAAHYARGRPPYSRELVDKVESEVGTGGRMLDMGCGPGVLAIEFASRFDEVVGLDPDADMLAEGARCAVGEGIANIRWVHARAEDLTSLDLGTFTLVTFGQSFHWMDRERVAEAVYDILGPGGAMVLVVHTHEGRPPPDSPGYPSIPHNAIQEIVRRYLGPQRRAGSGLSSPPLDRYEDALARTRFGVPQVVFAAGRADVVRDIDGVLSGYFSMSYAAPHLFGERRGEFEAEVKAELLRQSPQGLFWDWPGDTEILIARKSFA